MTINLNIKTQTITYEALKMELCCHGINFYENISSEFVYKLVRQNTALTKRIT